MRMANSDLKKLFTLRVLSLADPTIRLCSWAFVRRLTHKRLVNAKAVAWLPPQGVPLRPILAKGGAHREANWLLQLTEARIS